MVFTPRGYDPTDPPRSTITGLASPGAVVEVMNATDKVVAQDNVPESGEFTVALPEGEDGRNLRLIAISGGNTTKVVVPIAPPGQFTGVGRLDGLTTTLAQLATYEILQEAGSSFQATPPTALLGLLTKMQDATPELTNFVGVVDDVLAAAGSAGVPAFDLRGWDIAESPGIDAALAARYRNALAAAAQGYGLEIRCDPSRLNVMFTVDVSGRARDGNGAPQLIRQATKEGKVYLGFTSDESSPIASNEIPRKLTPNDPRYAMLDTGENGDEVAGDSIFTVVVPLPRGARLLYKYTNGAAGEGFTGAEEWPGNARIIEIEDVLTGRPDGEPDCLVVRRDSFGDEATNKNFVNLNTKAKQRGGTVTFDTDLGGIEVPISPAGQRVGGLFAEDLRGDPSLTPSGVPEARENGVCTICPAPLVLDPDDAVPPELLAAERLSVDRVRVRFSEPIHPEDAAQVNKYLYLDDAGRSVPVLSAAPSGADVILVVQPTHPRSAARLIAADLRDASVRGNALQQVAGSWPEVEVGPDETPPKILQVRSLSTLDLDPTAVVNDPTVGDLVEIILDERPEVSAASDPTRFAIENLEVLAAALVDEDNLLSRSHRLRLVTAVQGKSVPYALRVVGLRDPAGNALEQETTFDGFALYQVTFGVVPGFAFASSAGDLRGIPRNEELYLTGTPLAAARDLDGSDISIVAQGYSRTDVTGWPQFAMQASQNQYEGQAVHQKTILLPPGSWSWKAAHGTEGEYVRPPTTLQKVYKTLATTNDATGVRVHPATMIAANGVSYQGAALSESGDEPPRSTVLFKREAPNEVCEVHGDVICPYIVVGTWRDLLLDQGRTRDYDDGIITLEPHRPSLPDFTPPKLLDARARDSFSVLLSFDETIVEPTTIDLEVVRADDGYGVATRILSTQEVKPHQAVVRLETTSCDEALSPSDAYSVRYRGAKNEGGLVDREWRTQTILAPDSCTPFTPLTDVEPPRLKEVLATDLTELVVRFDEQLDPASITTNAFAVQQVSTSAALTVDSASVLPDRSSVRLTTAVQQILEAYRLTVNNISDAADPANVLTSSTVLFNGFGERDPPQVVRVRAISNNSVLVRFDEPIDSSSALDTGKYTIGGLGIIEAAFSGDPGRRSHAFNPERAPRVRDAVLLTVSAMTQGVSYELTVSGVRDLSGNPGQATINFEGVSSPPVVDLIIEYEISDRTRVAGSIPSRSISMAELQESREGVFILGARTSSDHEPVPGNQGPVNDTLGGFGEEGQPLEEIEPKLSDTGSPPDLVQGDGLFAIRVPAVPLGTTVIWKAFASFTTAYRDATQSPQAAFADALPGPSRFSDGQEYPGNENGIILLDDGDSDGEVRVRCLYGDEITYKKHTKGPAYLWVIDDRGVDP